MLSANKSLEIGCDNIIKRCATNCTRPIDGSDLIATIDAFSVIPQRA